MANVFSKSSGRHLRRMKGQFWTPDWLAATMVEYVLCRDGLTLFDPTVGSGAFFHAAWRLAGEKGFHIRLRGMEIDPSVLPSRVGDVVPTVFVPPLSAVGAAAASTDSGLLRTAVSCGNRDEAISRVTIEIGDFLCSPFLDNLKLEAVVGNPPYIRHHWILPDRKATLRRMAWEHTGVLLDGRAGLHVYFFIRVLAHMSPGGRMAFLLPADVCEGRFASGLWSWILRCFTCDAVLTFTPEASPFLGLYTNPMVFFIRRGVADDSRGRVPAGTCLSWALCRKPSETLLREWVRSGFPARDHDVLLSVERTLEEVWRTGLSRPPVVALSSSGAQSPSFQESFMGGGAGWKKGLTLGDVAQVVRGIVTGANDFFFLTDKRAKELGIPDNWLKPCIGRVRDVPGDVLTVGIMEKLRLAGRPVWLLSLDVPNGWENSPDCPEQLRQYLQWGAGSGFPGRSLLSRRRPWFRMEVREAPPFLFAYLGQRRSRFIRNLAGVVPLNCFLCVYPRPGVEVDWLWQVLTLPEVADGLRLVGKSYGGGAMKVEPGSLKKLPIPSGTLEFSSSVLKRPTPLSLFPPH